MSKKLRIIIGICLIFILFSFEAKGSGFFAFYYDTAIISGSISTGKIDVEIENLQVKNNLITWSESDGTLDNGTLASNTSNLISFDARNYGTDAIKYTLDIEIALENEISEKGIIFIYPHYFSDEEIYSNIVSGINAGAIVGLDALDNTEISFPSGIKQGMKAELASGILDGKTDLDGEAEDYKSYSYKIFFFEHDDVLLQPRLYHNTKIEINIAINAELNNNQTNWRGGKKKYFSQKSLITGVFPVISEVPQPKNFFVGQAIDINFADYATASDSLDGDLTSQIEFTVSPTFDAEQAGIYEVTYYVTNSLGNEAAPLTLYIHIWNFSKIISGNYHTLALTSHGKVYTWGYNALGQLGDGTTTSRHTPQLVTGLDNIIDVAAGNDCSFALASDGQAYSWGYNEGRLGDGTTTLRNRPTRVLQPVGVRFVSVAAHFATAGGVTDNGDVYTWGDGRYGVAGTGNGTTNRVPTKINVSNVVSISLGYYNGAAVTADGEVYTWGDNLNGQMGNGVTGGASYLAPAKVPYFINEGIKIKSISVGWYHMAAVSEQGNLYTWGYGAQGRLANGSEANKNTPQLINLDYAVKKAMADYYHTGILLEDGTVLFSGQNAYGKHGTGNATNNLTPKQPIGISDATDISLALDSSFVLVEGKTVYGMGYGGTGVLGSGNNNNSTTPVEWAFVPPPPH